MIWIAKSMKWNKMKRTKPNWNWTKLISIKVIKNCTLFQLVYHIDKIQLRQVFISMFVPKHVQNSFSNFVTRMLSNKCSLLRMVGLCISTDITKAATSSVALVLLHLQQQYLFLTINYGMEQNWNDCRSPHLFLVDKCCVIAAILQCRKRTERSNGSKSLSMFSRKKHKLYNFKRLQKNEK